MCRKVKSGPDVRSHIGLVSCMISLGHAQWVSDNSIVGCDGIVVTHSLGKQEVPGSIPGLTTFQVSDLSISHRGQ